MDTKEIERLIAYSNNPRETVLRLDDDAKLLLLSERELIKRLGMSALIILESLPSASKAVLISDTSFMGSHNISGTDASNLVQSLAEVDKIDLLVKKPQIFSKLNIPIFDTLNILSSISKEKLIPIITDVKIIKKLKLPPVYVTTVIEGLDENTKMRLIKDELLNPKKELTWLLEKTIASLSEETRKSLFEHPEFFQKRKNSIQWLTLLFDLPWKERLSIISDNRFEIEQDVIGIVLSNISGDLTKEDMISLLRDGKLIEKMKKSFKLGPESLAIVLANRPPEEILSIFQSEHDILLNKYKISLDDVTSLLEYGKQLTIAKQMPDLPFPPSEKKLFYATLSPLSKEILRKATRLPEIYTVPGNPRKFRNYEAKRNINVPEEYQPMLDINWNSKLREITNLNLDGDLTLYEGLGKIISLFPQHVDPEKRKKMEKLMEMCPDLRLLDEVIFKEHIIHRGSSVEEYKKGEAWIAEVIGQIDQNWTDIQKIAFIDHAIGKRMTYSFDVDTPCFDEERSKALWKVLANKEGICSGIAQVEQYMLERIGIKSEVIYSCNHAFVKAHNIRIPNNDGSEKVGDTLIDPTWNLENHRFGELPDCFALDTATMRQRDMEYDFLHEKLIDGFSHNALGTSNTILLSPEMLRKIFESIGVVKENAPLPTELDENTIIKLASCIKSMGMERVAQECLAYFALQHPEETRASRQTSSYLNRLLTKAVGGENCAVGRVFRKTDPDMKPVLYVCINNSKTNQPLFYYIDDETHQFVDLQEQSKNKNDGKSPLERFEEEFQMYEIDLKEMKGKAPWQKGGLFDFMRKRSGRE